MEKPILFNTEMVKAILDSRKTQTRRIIKPQPHCYGPNLAHKHDASLTDVFLSAEKGYLQCRRCGHYPSYSKENSWVAHYWKPPYQVGDTLWVRETWAPASDLNGVPIYLYKASFENDNSCYQDFEHWHPSIHMPRSAARIFLKVTNVRVEKLGDITEDGALSEGIKKQGIYDSCCNLKGYTYGDHCHDTAKDAFKRLWSDIYGKWQNDLWVWVIEFERTV